MRDRERFEEEMEYMKTHRYAIIAIVILLGIVIKIKMIIRKILIKLSGG
ncbi:hypothetical protein AVT97_gp33 [Sulfolobales Virus YNP2]|jgi:hypothetical protein|nr:hypothetical protein AVT97_gp33 [Sulfolobales Virus YNP2]ALG97196.1 hypothetical protein [Sulfolobales Virus YNP2]